MMEKYIYLLIDVESTRNVKDFDVDNTDADLVELREVISKGLIETDRQPTRASRSIKRSRIKRVCWELNRRKERIFSYVVQLRNRMEYRLHGNKDAPICLANG